MLANALPKMINLRKVHISSGPEGVMPVLKIVQASSPRLNALSLHIPDGFDIGNLEFHRIGHFAYRANGEHPISFLNAHRNTLRTIHLENPGWSFPSECLSIRNLTHIHFLGQFPPNSRTIEEIFTNGHQLECLSLNCLLDCMPSAQFRSLVSTPVLPFLRDFTFSISGMARRVVDRDLFPAIAEFLRDRKELRTLGLMVPAGEAVQRQVGFDASLWGVLPSLTGLKGLCITYPRDLAPGLASWLIPRSVRCLTLDGIGVTGSQRDLKSFLQVSNTAQWFFDADWDVEYSYGDSAHVAIHWNVRVPSGHGFHDYRGRFSDGTTDESWSTVLDCCQATGWATRRARAVAEKTSDLSCR